MTPLAVGIALLGGYLIGSRVGRHRWQSETRRLDALLQGQILPCLARRAADLGLKAPPPISGPGGAGLQAAALCAMIEAKERVKSLADPPPDGAELDDTIRVGKKH